MRRPSSAVLGLAFAATATAANAAPFDVYRSVCLDTGVDLAKVRAMSAGWQKLTEAERDQIAPGSAALEGWAVVKDGGRYLLSISSQTAGAMAGDRSGGAVVSCTMLTPKADEKAAAKAYGVYLKRKPSEERDSGMTTYTWAIQDTSNVTYHYLVAGGSLPGLSLSVSAIRK